MTKRQKAYPVVLETVDYYNGNNIRGSTLQAWKTLDKIDGQARAA